MEREIEIAVEGLIHLGVFNKDAMCRLGKVFQLLKNFHEPLPKSQPIRKLQTKAEINGNGNGIKTPAIEKRENPQVHMILEESVASKVLPEEPDPEFVDELTITAPEQKPARTPLPGFSKGYSERNLDRDPIVVPPRKGKNSFDPSREELESLRKVHTVKQIAQLHNVSIGTVNRKLRSFALTRS